MGGGPITFKIQLEKDIKCNTILDYMYDVIVIGGGVSGLGAAIYAARFNLNTLVIAGRLRGLLQDTHVVENYPGFTSVTGLELTEKFVEHAKSYDKIKIINEFATDIEKTKKGFIVNAGKKYGLWPFF